MSGFLEVFFTFLKMGCLTFGGGYAMMPVLEREVINKKGWITMDEAMDYYTIAQVTPGIIAVNVSTFVGYKRKGVIGGILATVGFVLPGAALVTAVALCLTRFADYPAVKHAFAGIRVAVAALILDTVIKLCKGLFKGAGSAKGAKEPKGAEPVGDMGSAANADAAKNRANTLRLCVAVAIFVLAFLFSAFFSASPVLIIIAAGILGFLVYRPRPAN
jgi:chromate transporter